MKRETHPKLMLIASMAVFGTLAPFVRLIPLSSGELALSRALLAAVLIILYLFLSHQRIPFDEIKKDIPLLLVSGGAMGINWILLFEAYKYTTVSIATLSYYFAPVIVTIACPLLFHEKLTGRQILCFFMSTLGLVLITLSGGFMEGGQNLVGILFGLGAASFYAAVILINKFIRRVEGIHRTLFQFLAAILVLVPYVWICGGLHLETMNPMGWAALLTVGFIHTGLTYCLYFSALKELPGQKAAILSYIDPLTAVLISVCFLGEPITLRQLLGGGLILGFTLINELAPQGKARDASSHSHHIEA